MSIVREILDTFFWVEVEISDENDAYNSVLLTQSSFFHRIFFHSDMNRTTSRRIVLQIFLAYRSLPIIHFSSSLDRVSTYARRAAAAVLSNSINRHIYNANAIAHDRQNTQIEHDCVHAVYFIRIW